MKRYKNLTGIRVSFVSVWCAVHISFIRNTIYLIKNSVRSSNKYDKTKSVIVG